MDSEYPYGHMVQEYYVGLERAVAARRAEQRARVKTRSQLARLQVQLRRKIRACFGGLPGRRTPLRARTTGVVRRRRYSIENVIYESRPGFAVTANLYVPAGLTRPAPAVLGTCGHIWSGKACDIYQAFSASLAAQGYVVLTYDPISQGERIQYVVGDGRDRPRACTHEHNMLGKQMSLVGDSFGSWRTWDGIRGLDYLLARPEVDRSRVGVTGNSGGGTMTTFLSALDGRFAMAAASCFVTSYLCNLENELPQDAEQCPPGLMAAGLDMADFFIARIPRPVLLLGQKRDFFDVRGLKGIYAELKRLYRIAGKADNVQLFVGPRQHGYWLENRQAMYRFFNRHAGVKASGREAPRWKPEPVKALQATPAGQVYGLAGARRVLDFTRRTARELAGRRKRLSAAALGRLIRRRLKLPGRAGPPHYRCVSLLWPGRGGRRRQRSAFAVESEPGIVALLHVAAAERTLRRNREEHVYNLPRDERTTVYVPHLSAAEEVQAGKAPPVAPLLAVEVRGIGHLSARTCGEADMFAPYGADYMYADHGEMLGRPYAGQRVHDLLYVLDLLGANGCRSVHLVGRGLGAIWATFAACLHPLVRRVTLHNALRSYHELTQTAVYRWPLSAMVGGILADFDLPDCYRLLRARKRLRIIDPWDARMRPVGRK